MSYTTTQRTAPYQYTSTDELGKVKTFSMPETVTTVEHSDAELQAWIDGTVKALAIADATGLAPPPIQPPAGTFKVGVVAFDPVTGTVSGKVIAGTKNVEIDIDGSAVRGVFLTAPATDGSFSGALNPIFKDGVQHEGLAWAIAGNGTKQRFDAVTGNNNTFVFTWK